MWPIGANTYLSTFISYLTCVKDMVPTHFADNRRKVLTTAIKRSRPSDFLSRLVCTNEVRIRFGSTFSSRIILTKFVRALRKFSLFARSNWQPNISKF